MQIVRVGIIGLGGRGVGLMLPLLRMSDVTITALCDSYEDRILEAAKKVIKKHKGNPFLTSDYKQLLLRDDVDVVLIATSWQKHIEIACEAMKAGKFTAMEVGGVYDLNECYKIVNTYEETGTPFIFLENCCYGQRELMCLNMARNGLFGEIVQCNGAYCHDLREEVAFGKENRHYRLEHYLKHNCENYPTHDLGPIAKILGINRGNRMTRLISIPSAAKGLHQYIADKKPNDKELLNAEIKQADIVTTIIECENGEIIHLTLETTLPRNYSRGFSINGTKGMYQEDGDVVYIDDITRKQFKRNIELYPWYLYHNAKNYSAEYDSPLWKNKSTGMRLSGHGGMDYLVLRSMVVSAKGETVPPIDVYDAASWMCITALSEQSIKNGSIWVDIPDFTKGKYKSRVDSSTGKYAIE